MLPSGSLPELHNVSEQRDALIVLQDGDAAVHVGTGEIVQHYCGKVYYLVPTGGGPRESQYKLDVQNPVEGLIHKNRLPAVWVILPKPHIDFPEEWKYTD